MTCQTKHRTYDPVWLWMMRCAFGVALIASPFATLALIAWAVWRGKSQTF